MYVNDRLSTAAWASSCVGFQPHGLPTDHATDRFCCLGFKKCSEATDSSSHGTTTSGGSVMCPNYFANFSNELFGMLFISLKCG